MMVATSTPVLPNDRARWPVPPSRAITVPSRTTGTHSTLGDRLVSCGRSRSVSRGPTYASPRPSTSQFGIVWVVRGQRRGMLSSVPVWVASSKTPSVMVTMKAESVLVRSRNSTTASSSREPRSMCRARLGPAWASFSMAAPRSSASSTEPIRSPTAASTWTSVAVNGSTLSRSRNRRSPVAASDPSGIQAAEQPTRSRSVAGASSWLRRSCAIGLAVSMTCSAIGPIGHPLRKPSSSGASPTASVRRRRSPTRSATQTTVARRTSATSAIVRRTIASGAAGIPITVSSRTSRAVPICSSPWVTSPICKESSDTGPICGRTGRGRGCCDRWCAWAAGADRRSRVDRPPGPPALR